MYYFSGGIEAYLSVWFSGSVLFCDNAQTAGTTSHSVACSDLDNA